MNPGTSPFHAGESAVQQRAGVRQWVDAAGHRLIRDFMPQQHQDFFARLPSLMVGSVDAQGRPWASILVGRPGFIQVPHDKALHVVARPASDDPLADHIRPGAALGLLGIEPQTRRRNRMNGHVLDADAAGFRVGVDQSFGNCPKYIQAREPHWPTDRVADAETPPAQVFGSSLSEPARSLVQRADTLFIASAAAQQPAHGGVDGVDVSHRGGNPGFVRTGLDGAGRSVLTLPDFRGNNLFNTLGNIAAHPRAGMLFIDYRNGDLLQLSGSADIVWDGAELASFVGAQRLLKLTVERALRRPAALPLRWSEPEFASQLAATGIWPPAA